MEDILFNIIFILPGFFSYLVVKTFKIGFGKRSDVFDKTLYSLIFDIPIILITIILVKNTFVGNWVFNKKVLCETIFDYIEYKNYLLNNPSKFLLLMILITAISILVGVLWMVILNLFSCIYNRIKNRKLFFYTTVWNDLIVNEEESKPIQVFKNGDEEPIVQGFLRNVSNSLDDDLEIEVYNVELFEQCLKMGLIEEIEFIYYNLSKELKIIVYKSNKIDEHIGKVY